MCDTLVALPWATADGSTLLAKNSDREPNEAQAISYIPRAQHAAGATLRCTYIDIPQVRETNAVLLSRPFWMWGAEMGANEHGVVIGNEAVFAKVRVAETGLTGMDLLRLALERAANAESGVEVITDLLARHGQGGSGGYRLRSFYHNSFIVADKRTAWVLETVDRHWAARRVHDVATISNGITIGNDFDLASPDLVNYAVKRGWCKGRDDFDFAACYSDRRYTRSFQCSIRQPHTEAGLRARARGLTIADMMRLLRSHQEQGDGEVASYEPARGSNADICMHYGGLNRSIQTAGSLVAHLRADGPATLWLTGTSAPCLGVFKPFYLSDAESWARAAEALGPEPGARYDPASLWWQGEDLHRSVLIDYPTRAACFADERDALEASFLRVEAEARDQAARDGVSNASMRLARSAIAEWTERVRSVPPQRRLSWRYRRAWQAQAEAAGMPWLDQ